MAASGVDRLSRSRGPLAAPAGDATLRWIGRATTPAIARILFAAAWSRFSFLRYPFFADDYPFLDQTRGGSVWNSWALRDPLRNYWRPLSRQIDF